MVSIIAIVTTGMLQVMGTSVFLHQPHDRCSPAPALASWIFLIATMVLLYDLEIFPERYLHLPNAVKVACDLLACILLVEISLIIVWCRLELLMHWLVRYGLFNYSSVRNGVRQPLQCAFWSCELVGLAFLSNVFALAALCFTLDATRCTDTLLLWCHTCERFLLRFIGKEFREHSSPTDMPQFVPRTVRTRHVCNRCCIGCGKKMNTSHNY